MIPRAAVWIRLAVVAGVVGFGIATWLGGVSLGPLALVALTVLTTGSVVRPESVAPLCLLGVEGWIWLTHGPAGVTWWVLAAAGGVLATHLGLAVAAAAPIRTVLDPRLGRLWVRRGLLVYLAAPVTAGLVWLVHPLPHQVAAFVAAMLVIVVTTGVALARIAKPL